MRKLGLLILAVVCGFLMPFSAVAELSTGAGHADSHPGYVPGEVLVKFRVENRTAGLQNYRQGWNIQIRQRFRSIGVDHLRLPQGLTVEEALAIFRMDPDVIYAEPNYYRYVAAEVPLPDDEYFSRLWGMHNIGQIVNETAGIADADIDAPEAWEVTTGSADVVVAVIDSGLDFTHPDLSGNFWTNPDETAGNGVDDDGNGFVDDVRGWDFINDDNAWDPVNKVPLPNDASGHGTHVAGTIAASGDDSWGVAGVSWHAKIMSLRTFNAFGVGDTADAIKAFEYANAKGADIINCSWGGTGDSDALYDVIEASSALVVCAAGNSGADADALPHYPAAYNLSNIVSVAATDADDSLAAFSNYGAVSVDVAAPGVNIYSCAPGRRALWTDDFDDGEISDWKSGGPNNDWGLTTAQAVSKPYSLADSPDGDYSQRTNSWIRTKNALVLSGARNTRLEFKLKGRSEAGYDFLKVEVSTDGSVWIWQPVKLSGIGIVPWVSGTILEWTDALVDLSAYDGVAELYVRFAVLTDWTNNFDGWYIDDVAVTAASSSYDGSEYQFLNGTSMAAPHVSGVAALVKAENPLLSTADIKAVIAGTVDPIAALNGYMTSGGRLNAFGAVTAPGSGILQFSAPDYTVYEDDGFAEITVTRTGGSDGTVRVIYAASDGTATQGADYAETGGTLSWDGGESGNKTFTVPIINDDVTESSETIVLTLSLSDPQSGAILGSTSTAVLTIFDDDYRPGILQFSPAAVAVGENAGSVTITVTRTGGSDGEVSVSYAASGGTAQAGSDYTAVSGTLTWGSGDDLPKTFDVPVIDDTALEEDETVVLTLSNPTGGAILGTAYSAVVTIADNDSLITGTVDFSAPAYTVDENGVSAEITVIRTNGSDGAVSVSYAASDGTATQGADYTETVGMLSWADGESGAKTFEVPVIDDNLYEPDETVNLNLAAPTGGLKLGEQSTAVLTIMDDDPPNNAPVIGDIPDQTIAEGASFATIDLDAYVDDPDNTDADIAWSYSGNSQLTVSIVDRVATISIPSADWTASETITFKATDPGGLFAEDAATFTVTPVNDAPVADAGPDEIVIVGSTVTLDGSASSDAEGDALTFSWTFVAKPVGSTAVLPDPDAINPSFVADQAGDYVVELIVSDGTDYSAPATVTITADSDTDNDGVPQSLDNCTAEPNPDQLDTDNDGYGNLCDGDLNNDGSTDTLDLQIFKAAQSIYDPDADFDGNDIIDGSDLNIYKGLHRWPPGPSCCGD